MVRSLACLLERSLACACVCLLACSLTYFYIGDIVRLFPGLLVCPFVLLACLLACLPAAGAAAAAACCCLLLPAPRAYLRPSTLILFFFVRSLFVRSLLAKMICDKSSEPRPLAKQVK